MTVQEQLKVFIATQPNTSFTTTPDGFKLTHIKDTGHQISMFDYTWCDIILKDDGSADLRPYTVGTLEADIPTYNAHQSDIQTMLECMFMFD